MRTALGVVGRAAQGSTPPALHLAKQFATEGVAFSGGKEALERHPVGRALSDPSRWAFSPHDDLEQQPTSAWGLVDDARDAFGAHVWYTVYAAYRIPIKFQGFKCVRGLETEGLRFINLTSCKSCAASLVRSTCMRLWGAGRDGVTRAT